jgi:hypothetical protein
VSTVGSILTAAPVLPASPSASPGAPVPAALAFAALFAGVLVPQALPAVALLGAPQASHVPDAEVLANEGIADATPGASKADDAEKTSVTDVDTKSVALGAAALGLDPTLKAKLARVIVRMKEEFGRDVTVVEGVRSQQRQDTLFAQGRGAAGPVVTWTRHSLHTAGRAADVAIDGGYGDAKGFALLRRIASEEGLHTLGAKDPGHLELAGAAPHGDVAAGVSPTPIVRALGIAGVARVASVATLAPLAGVARLATAAAVASVAAVARVAAPDSGGAVTQVASSAFGAVAMDKASAFVAAQGATVANVAVASLRSRVTRAANDSAPPIVPGDAGTVATSGATVLAARGHGQAGSRDGAASQQNSDDSPDARRDAPRARAIDGRVDARGGEASYQTLDRGTADASDASGATLKTDASALTEARAERVMRLQDAPTPRTLSRLTLSLDDGRGGQDQVRIGLRGSSVGASFDMRDAGGADRIAARMGELTRALEQHGLEPQAFQVRSGAAIRDTDVARMSTQTSDAPRGVPLHTGGANARQQFGAGDQARQQFSQHDDQQERAQRRQDDQRRRGTSFSLTTEAS